MPLLVTSPGGSATGAATAFTLNADVATDAESGTYQTWAEIRALAVATAAPIRIRVVGINTTSGTTGPDDFRHVTFVADDPSSSLTFTEGVELRGPSFDGVFAVDSTATTTVALQYDDTASGVFRNVSIAGDTRGLITATADANLRFENVAIGNHAFESTTASTVNVYTPGSEWVDTEQFFGSSGATFEFKRNQDTAGEPDLSALTATCTKVSTPYVGAVRPDLPAGCLVRFRLDDAAGTTTINNSGNGTAFSLGTISGAGSELFGVPGPIGDRLLIEGIRYFHGAGGMAYAPSVTNFSASCWIQLKKNPAVGGANFVSLFGKLNATDSTFALGFDLNAGEFKCKVGAGGTDVSSTGKSLLASERYLLAVTYDGSNIRLYVNGVLNQTTAQSGALDWDAAQPWIVGNAGASGAIVLLDEVRFLDYVQTLSEIKAEYNAGAFNGAIGVIDAHSINGVGISSTAPVAGMVMTATGTTAAAFETPAMLWSPSSFVAASSGSASSAADITCGQEFEVYRDYYCDGVRFHWASSSGTPTCTVELWDDAGAVLKTTTQAVSTSATTYEVLFGTPQDLSAYKATKLVVSVWQQTGAHYYSVVVTSPVGDAAPALIGRDVWSRGSIYDAGHVFPAINTSVEVYGVEPILRLK